jgi:hypothetical protein
MKGGTDISCPKNILIFVGLKEGIRKPGRVSHCGGDLSSRVCEQHPAIPHTCTRRTARVSRQDRNAFSGRVREAYLPARVSRILEKERWKSERGRRETRDEEGAAT